MAEDIVMPRLSDSMEEGTILRWIKSVGDEVAVGEELVEIETDKANMVYESDAAGTLIEMVAEEGDDAADRRGDRAGRGGRARHRLGRVTRGRDRDHSSGSTVFLRRAPAPARAAPHRGSSGRPQPGRLQPVQLAMERRCRAMGGSRPRRSPAGSPPSGASTWPRCRGPGPAGGSSRPTWSRRWRGAAPEKPLGKRRLPSRQPRRRPLRPPRQTSRQRRVRPATRSRPSCRRRWRAGWRSRRRSRRTSTCRPRST